jgi:hypothetical protein
MEKNYSQTFDRLWKHYVTLCPSALKIQQLLKSKGKLVNDHIAFRTLDDPRVNSRLLASHFEEFGFAVKGKYHFEEKKLHAIHMEHPDPLAPKVFISELISSAFSGNLQSVLKKVVDEIPQKWQGNKDIIFQGRLWSLPSYEIYENLRKESEYAAWLYVYGYCANHFTIYVNYLDAFHNLADLNKFLMDQGFSMNTSGGLIKGDPSVYLEQSSTLADKITLEFQEGSYEIPGCYYEFAYRYQKGDSIFNGFVTQSADRIFESTHKRNSK